MKRLEKLRHDGAQGYLGLDGYDGHEATAFCHGFDASTKELMRVIEIYRSAFNDIEAYYDDDLQWGICNNAIAEADAILNGEKNE